MYNMTKISCETIAGIATGPPGVSGAGIGVIRLSGSDAIRIAECIFKRRAGGRLLARRVYYGRIVFHDTGEIIDEGLMFVMPAPKSYTCEDVAEISCHGGPVIISEVLRAAVKAGARPAEPGEFTKRAFLNGRLDLTQAEAVMDLIGAKSAAALKIAGEQLNGALRQTVERESGLLLSIIAAIEVKIDYPSDEVVDDIDYGVLKRDLEGLRGRLAGLADTARYGGLLKNGVKTVILGKPNVGKSSLLNAVLGEERAIVADLPGTTRDVVTEYITLGQGELTLRISDTAGIRETDDTAEGMGVERAVKTAREADLIIYVFDSSVPLTKEDTDILKSLDDYDAVKICAANKSDLPEGVDFGVIENYFSGGDIYKVSCVTREGVAELCGGIVDKLTCSDVHEDGVVITNARHAAALSDAAEYVGNAIDTIDNGLSEDFITIDLMNAHESLSRLTGETTGEAVIDKIFSSFCLGK